MAPRPLEPEELVQVLSKERKDQRNRLVMLKQALEKRNYDVAAEIVSCFHAPLGQHTFDEEIRMLNLSPDIYSRKGTRETTEVFERPIRGDGMSSKLPQSLASEKVEVNGLNGPMRRYADAEEARISELALKARQEKVVKRQG